MEHSQTEKGASGWMERTHSQWHSPCKNDLAVEAGFALVRRMRLQCLPGIPVFHAQGKQWSCPLPGITAFHAHGKQWSCPMTRMPYVLSSGNHLPLGRGLQRDHPMMMMHALSSGKQLLGKLQGDHATGQSPIVMWRHWLTPETN